MHYVTDSLLVGNAEDAQSPPPFIESVLFVAGDFDIEPPTGVEFARVPLLEYGEADPMDVMEAVEWLEHRVPDRRLMVCCRAGMGRSVSMVIAYLCCVEGMRYEDAVQLLCARRPGATPLPNLETTIEIVKRIRRAQHEHAQAQDPGTDPADTASPAAG